MNTHQLYKLCYFSFDILSPFSQFHISRLTVSLVYDHFHIVNRKQIYSGAIKHLFVAVVVGFVGTGGGTQGGGGSQSGGDNSGGGSQSGGTNGDDDDERPGAGG